MELGTVNILDPDGNVISEAYYLAVWKNVDGQWKIYRDVVSGLPIAAEQKDMN